MAYEKRDSKTLQARIEKFIQQGKDKHGKNAYDYSIARRDYINNRTPVRIKCKKCKGSKPFLVYPFAHTDKGDNQKGTCENCYVPKQTISDTRWKKTFPKESVNLKKKLKKSMGKNIVIQN